MRRLIVPVTAITLFAALSLTPSPQADPETPLRFEPPEVVSAMEANYPPFAANPGTVVLQIMIGASGEIEEVRVIRSLPPFTEEAERSVKKWKFKAARLDGKPVRAAMAVVFTFPPRPFC